MDASLMGGEEEGGRGGGVQSTAVWRVRRAVSRRCPCGDKDSVNREVIAKPRRVGPSDITSKIQTN